MFGDVMCWLGWAVTSWPPIKAPSGPGQGGGRGWSRASSRKTAGYQHHLTHLTHCHEPGPIGRTLMTEIEKNGTDIAHYIADIGQQNYNWGLSASCLTTLTRRVQRVEISR